MVCGGHCLCLLDRRFLDHSTFGVGVDILLAFLSLVYVAAYITNTYLPLNTVRHFDSKRKQVVHWTF